MINADFIIPEADVATRLGMTLELLASLRGKRAVRWEKMANGQFCWSELGIAQLQAQISEKNGARPAEEPLSPPVAKVELFVVVRARTPRVLHVVRPGTAYNAGLPISLWLPRPRAALFRPGMAVLGRYRNDLVWDFEGNPARPEKGRRLPRRPGQW